MNTYTKKRIEIILEAGVLHRLVELLDRLAVTGYTVVPAMAGRGRGGSWTQEGLVSDTGQMVMVICITDPARVDEVLTPVYKLVKRQIGIVTISDVAVIRPDHF